MKTLATRDLKLDRKVFFHPGADSRQGAEWVVTVHEPVKVTSATFEDQFSVNRVCHLPSDLPASQMDTAKGK